MIATAPATTAPLSVPPLPPLPRLPAGTAGPEPRMLGKWRLASEPASVPLLRRYAATDARLSAPSPEEVPAR